MLCLLYCSLNFMYFLRAHHDHNKIAPCVMIKVFELNSIVHPQEFSKVDVVTENYSCNHIVWVFCHIQIRLIIKHATWTTKDRMSSSAKMFVKLKPSKCTHVRTTPDVNDLDNFKDFNPPPPPPLIILHLSLFTCTLHIGVNSPGGFQSSNLH